MRHGLMVALAVVLAVSGASQVFGQLVLAPLDHARSGSHARTTEEVDTVYTQLPFFDDFSTSLRSPDSIRWAQGGGTYVSNTMSYDPPTFNAVTFDGADAGGIPYNFEDSQAEGPADRLTSRFMDLSAYRASDSLIFTFFWQPEGLGQIPNQNDSLVLQFSYAQGGNSGWENIWARPGDSVQAFQREKILINQSRFLHKDFRFRFYNYARLSGGYDTWHVDYIALYPSRGVTVEDIADVALGQAPTSLLRRYHSMPARQFLADPLAALADTVSTRMNNMSETFVLLRPNAFLEEVYSQTDLGSLPTVAIGQNGTRFEGNVLLRPREKMDLLAAVDREAIAGMDQDSLLLSYTFFLDSAETAAVLPTRSNDTLQAFTLMKDYYAYDDGSAEFGLGVAQQGGQVAVAFEASQPDTITHIDVYFPRIGANAMGLTYNLTIWGAIDTADFRNDRVLHVQNVAFQYTDTVNKFQRIPLDRRTAVNGTFYIGYTQLSDQMMVVGYDANTNGGQHIFYNIASKWQPNVSIPGSMMIRPVFGAAEAGDIVLSAPTHKERDFRIYPNPNRGYLRTTYPFRQVMATDLQGRKISEWEFSLPMYELNLSKLKAGQYLLQFQLENGQRVVRQVLVD